MQSSPVENDFLDAILCGDRLRALAVARQRFQTQGLASLYEDMITPALHELGLLWERNVISVADEHLATALAQSVIAALYPELQWPPGTASAVVSCVGGERHEIGARMVADLLELDGWRVLFTGGDTPTESLVAICRRAEPVLVGLSVALPMHLETAQTVIAELRAAHAAVKIIVGGRALHEPTAAARLGADGSAESARDAVTLAAAWKRLDAGPGS